MLFEFCYLEDRPGRQDLEELRRKVRNSNKDCYSFHIAEGIYNYHQGKVHAAIRCFQQAADIWPHYHAAWKWLAEAHVALGQTETAEKLIKSAIQCAEKRVPSLFGIHAYILEMGGRPVNAIHVLESEESAKGNEKNLAFKARAHLAIAQESLRLNDPDWPSHHLIKAKEALDLAQSKNDRDTWLNTEKLTICGLGRNLKQCREMGFDTWADQIDSRLEPKLKSINRADQKALRLVALGRDNDALTELETAFKKREPLVPLIWHDPRYHHLRNRKPYRELWDEVRNRFGEPAA